MARIGSALAESGQVRGMHRQGIAGICQAFDATSRKTRENPTVWILFHATKSPLKFTSR
jgi:hypothetical protein